MEFRLIWQYNFTVDNSVTSELSEVNFCQKKPQKEFYFMKKEGLFAPIRE